MENGGKAGGVGGMADALEARASEAGRRMEEQFEDVRGWADEASERVREFARERPGTAIAVAAGVGFLLGRIFSRT
jgi:ElaB/YqjD/DUF883 family membrane-anchored ribosome-binding protein